MAFLGRQFCRWYLYAPLPVITSQSVIAFNCVKFLDAINCAVMQCSVVVFYKKPFLFWAQSNIVDFLATLFSGREGVEPPHSVVSGGKENFTAEDGGMRDALWVPEISGRGDRAHNQVQFVRVRQTLLLVRVCAVAI